VAAHPGYGRRPTRWSSSSRLALVALGRKYGTDAIWLQIIPFALMHVWKPEIEQLSTLVGGAVFGLLAWRTRSFLWGGSSTGS